MLYLISLGIRDEKDISLKALEAGRTCDKLYLEQYTTQTAPPLTLEKLFGKRIKQLKRAELEEKAGSLLNEAKTNEVGILIGGDALFATTHLSLILDCKKQGIPYKIIHGSSILTAVGESGLSLYKFGEIVTVPRWKENFQPSGFYETILKNKKMGLHSLILLEIDMGVKEGMGILLGIERRKRKKLFHSLLVAISKMGSEEQVMGYGTAKDLEGEAPAVLLLPGRLNAFEKEFLEHL